MFSKKTLVLFSLAFAVAGAAIADGPTVVTLPDTSKTTTFSADVSEEATVTTPDTVAFGSITDVSSDHDAALTSSVSATSIILVDGNRLQISLKANTAAFTHTGAGTETTYAASDVEWNAPTWTGGTGAAGALDVDTTTYNEVATSTANAATLSTTLLQFTLKGDSAVRRAGVQSLVATWKFASIS